MQLITSAQQLRTARSAMSGRVALVPTMGALHAGHLAHIGRGRAAADHVVVSVFVNPTQFGPHEDFQRYPRTLEVDVAKCETAGADLVFAPPVEVMYPPRTPAVEMDVPAVSSDLEGQHRPGHFPGVCRVVLKLLNLVQPAAVTLGQKDYQQLCVVRSMVEDLLLPIEVLAVPTVREDDGLAMSSRNRYLDGQTRKHALGLSKALRQAVRLVADGEADPAVLESIMHEAMAAHHVEVDYAAVRSARDLAKPDNVSPDDAVALVAGRVGEVRLIDNMPLG